MEIKTPTLDMIYEKMKNYMVGQDFQPLQIIFKIRPPLFVSNPWLYLDSLVQYLCLREALGELFYILPSEINLELDNLMLPIKKTDDVYHASVSQFDKAPLYQSTIYKRFDDKNTYKLKPKQRQGRIHTDRGYFKDFMINLPFLLSEEVSYYTCADKAELERLLPNITNIGKKTDIGGGRVLDIEIKEVESDYSFYKDGRIMRPIPPHLAKKLPLMEGTTYMNTTYKPPYWDKRNVAMCLCPKNEVSMGL